MKKIIFIILVLLIPIKINAYGYLEQPYSNDLWYMMSGGDKPVFSRQWVRYSIDGNTVFCIQPGVEITTSNYVGSTNLNEAPYNLEKMKKIELIGYYGYDYPNHQTLEYRMATQALIWEEISGQNVEFYTGGYGTGNHIDISKERNEIKILINNHNSKPSFDGQIYNIGINDEIEIIDLNNIINEYEIIVNNNFESRIEDNKIYIKPLIVGNIEIKLKKKKYDKLQTVIYKGEDSISQNVGLFRYSEPVVSNLIINSSGKIELNKTGEVAKTDENKELKYEFVPLENVEFGLYAYEDIKDKKGNIIFRKNDLIINKITDINGKITFNDLYIGKYKLKETKTLQNYILDEKEYIIEIKQNDVIKVINLQNKLKKITVQVPSTGKNKSYLLHYIGLIFIGAFILYVKR